MQYSEWGCNMTLFGGITILTTGDSEMYTIQVMVTMCEQLLPNYLPFCMPQTVLMQIHLPCPFWIANKLSLHLYVMLHSKNNGQCEQRLFSFWMHALRRLAHQSSVFEYSLDPKQSAKHINPWEKKWEWAPCCSTQAKQQLSSYATELKTNWDYFLYLAIIFMTLGVAIWLCFRELVNFVRV